MAASDDFEKRLRANLERHTAVSEDEAGIGIEILLPILMDILTGLLSGCLGKFGPAQSAANITRLGYVQRYLIRDRIARDPDIPAEDRQRAFGAIASTLTATPPEDANALVAEFDAENVPWDMF